MFERRGGVQDNEPARIAGVHQHRQRQAVCVRVDPGHQHTVSGQGRKVEHRELQQPGKAHGAEVLAEVDALNPQVAARLAGAFDLCLKLNRDSRIQALMSLEKVLSKPLSPNSFEILSKTANALKRLSLSPGSEAHENSGV